MKENPIVQSSFRENVESSLIKPKANNDDGSSKNIPTGFINNGNFEILQLLNGTHMCIVSYDEKSPKEDFRYKIISKINQTEEKGVELLGIDGNYSLFKFSNEDPLKGCNFNTSQTYTYSEVKEQCDGMVGQIEGLLPKNIDFQGVNDLSLSEVNHIIENIQLELYPIKSKSFMLLVEEEHQLTLMSNINNFMYLYSCENDYNCNLEKSESGIITDEDEYTQFMYTGLQCSMLYPEDDKIYCELENMDLGILHRLISLYNTTLKSSRDVQYSTEVFIQQHAEKNINEFIDSIKDGLNKTTIKENNNLVEYKLPEIKLVKTEGYDYGSYSEDKRIYLTNNYYVEIDKNTKSLIRRVYDFEIKEEEKCNTYKDEKILKTFKIDFKGLKYEESGEIPSDEEIFNTYAPCNLTSRFYSCSELNNTCNSLFNNLCGKTILDPFTLEKRDNEYVRKDSSGNNLKISNSAEVTKIVNGLYFTSYPIASGVIVDIGSIKVYMAYDRELGRFYENKYSISNEVLNETIVHYSNYSSMEENYFLFRKADNPNKIYNGLNYPNWNKREEYEAETFRNGGDAINRYRNDYINGIKRIIGEKLVKTSYYGYYHGNNYVFLLGEKQLAFVFSNTAKNYKNDDVFKLIYNYELVDGNPHILNVTSLDYIKSSFLLSPTTATAICGENEFNTSIPHSLNDSTCEIEIEKLTCFYSTPFIVTINVYESYDDEKYNIHSKYFNFVLMKRSRSLMNRMIDSPLQTTPITSHTFAIINDNSINAITPGFIYERRYGKCGENIVHNITEFKDEDSYTVINSSSKEVRYCLNVTYDVNSAYCTYDKPTNNRFISLYSDKYKRYPKKRFESIMESINATFDECLNETLERADKWISNILNQCNNEVKAKSIEKKRKVFSGLIEDDDERMLENPTKLDTDIAGIYESGSVVNSKNEIYQGYFITPTNFTYISKDSGCRYLSNNNNYLIANCEIKYIYKIEIKTVGNNEIIWIEDGFNNETSFIRYTIGGENYEKSIQQFDQEMEKIDYSVEVEDPFDLTKPKIILKENISFEIEFDESRDISFTRYNTTIVNLLSKIAYNIDNYLNKIQKPKSFYDKVTTDDNDYYAWGFGNERFSMTINKEMSSISSTPDIVEKYKYYLFNDKQCGRLYDGKITPFHPIDFDNNYIATFNSVETTIQKEIGSLNLEIYSYLSNLPNVTQEDNYRDEEIPSDNDNNGDDETEDFYEGSDGYVIGKDEDDGLSGGEIAAIVIACVVFVCIIIVIVYFCACRRKKEKHVSSGPYEDAPASIYTHKVSVNGDKVEGFQPKANKSFITVKA